MGCEASQLVNLSTRGFALTDTTQSQVDKADPMLNEC